MPAPFTDTELSALTVAQRISLVERLCESIRRDLENLPLTPEQLLHIREMVHQIDAGNSEAWVEFKRTLRGQDPPNP